MENRFATYVAYVHVVVDIHKAFLTVEYTRDDVFRCRIGTTSHLLTPETLFAVLKMRITSDPSSEEEPYAFL